jgi:hypothetical protein
MSDKTTCFHGGNRGLQRRPGPPRSCPRNIQSPPELVRELLISVQQACDQRCRSAPQPQAAQAMAGGSDARRPLSVTSKLAASAPQEPPTRIEAAMFSDIHSSAPNVRAVEIAGATSTFASTKVHTARAPH